MYMRLGFAVAVHVDPDVLLVDEVLAVGDEAFTHKCLDKFAEFRARGKTILIVTHQLDLVERFCDAALWLDRGTMRAEGEPKRVIDAYLLDVAQSERPPAAAASRWGSGEVEITGVDLHGPAGPADVFESGSPVEIRIRARASRPVDDFVFGIAIHNLEGVCCYGTNTQVEGARPGELSGDADVRLAFDRLDLVEGNYTLDAAVHRQNGAPYDFRQKVRSFRVASRIKDVGIYRPRHRWSFGGGVRIAGLE
jgi:hypothetical protein